MKFNGFNSKRGVSPLIATVLLIAFAVALGAVVMNWGRAQLDPGQQNQGSCPSVDIAIERIGERPNVCYSTSGDNLVSFLLRNNGNIAVTKFRITLISEQQDTYNHVLNQNIEPGETNRMQLNHPSNFGKIQKIRITPIHIADPNNPLSEQICVEKSIEVLNPLQC
jgi:flagellin-like protein